MKLNCFSPDTRPASMQRRDLLIGAGAAALLAGCAGSRAVVDVQHFDPARRMGPTIWTRSSSAYRFEQLSFVSADGARRYRVWLAIPRGAVPANGYPLICMLDGNAVADSLTADDLEAAARAGDPPVIAAIGPDSDLRFDVNARAFDYTPAVRNDGPTFEDEVRRRPGGGGDLFLDLIEQRIVPAIASRVPLDSQRRTLWGHSYGGLLVLHTLFHRPALFTRYAAADASLWWHERFILREADAALPLPAGRETTLLLMAGTAPRPPRANGDAAASRAHDQRASVPPDGAHRLADQLAQRPHLRVLYREFPSLTHGPMLAASIRPALVLAARREGDL
jgi:uncharacterized protein